MVHHSTEKDEHSPTNRLHVYWLLSEEHSNLSTILLLPIHVAIKNRCHSALIAKRSTAVIR